MYTKEQIIDEIKRLANDLGTESLRASDFELHSTIPISTLKYYLGSWPLALKAAGVGESTRGLETGDDDELLKDLVRLYDKYGETPTLALIKKEGKYSDRLYKIKWNSVNEAFLMAKRKFMKKPGEDKKDLPGEDAAQKIDDYFGIADEPGQVIAGGPTEEEAAGFFSTDDTEKKTMIEVLNPEDEEKIKREQEKTSKLKKKAPTSEEIDFGAMIDEIEKEEQEEKRLNKINGKDKPKPAAPAKTPAKSTDIKTEIVVPKPGKPKTGTPGKPHAAKTKTATAKPVETGDIKTDELNLNEVTRVQKSAHIAMPAAPKKKEAGKSTESKKKGKFVDFSDIGLDEVNIISDAEDGDIEKVVEDDKTKEIDRKDIPLSPFKDAAPSKEPPKPSPKPSPKPPPKPLLKPPPKPPSRASKEEAEGDLDVKDITYIPRTIPPKKTKKKRKVFGEPINFRGLRFAPLNEHGVLYIFGMVSQDLGFLIESIKPGYPAGEGMRCFDKKNNSWEHIHIDFEYKSSHFAERGLDEEDCDLIVCWIHDWKDCPIEVLELRSTIKHLE
ncbi:MAG: hypothetical protein KAW12_26795 [Candidatus Aminicenantes bacterium]|nr:hypothetical protein [Candidatus Aminicenantes bacterium]